MNTLQLNKTVSSNLEIPLNLGHLSLCIVYPLFQEEKYLFQNENMLNEVSYVSKHQKGDRFSYLAMFHLRGFSPGTEDFWRHFLRRDQETN